MSWYNKPCPMCEYDFVKEKWSSETEGLLLLKCEDCGHTWEVQCVRHLDDNEKEADYGKSV